MVLADHNVGTWDTGLGLLPRCEPNLANVCWPHGIGGHCESGDELDSPPQGTESAPFSCRLGLGQILQHMSCYIVMVK